LTVLLIVQEVALVELQPSVKAPPVVPFEEVVTEDWDRMTVGRFNAQALPFHVLPEAQLAVTVCVTV
jgi:hypothetical protein